MKSLAGLRDSFVVPPITSIVPVNLRLGGGPACRRGDMGLPVVPPGMIEVGHVMHTIIT